jgi:hypothetical protein
MRLRGNISLKSCGYAVAEVLPSGCGIAIANIIKQICARPPLDDIVLDQQRERRDIVFLT